MSASQRECRPGLTYVLNHMRPNSNVLVRGQSIHDRLGKGRLRHKCNLLFNGHTRSDNMRARSTCFASGMSAEKSKPYTCFQNVTRFS